MTTATLGLAIDSGQAERAAVDLDKLTVAAQGAEAAAERLTGGTARAAAAARQLAAAADAEVQHIAAATAAANLNTQALQVNGAAAIEAGRGAQVAAMMMAQMGQNTMANTAMLRGMSAAGEEAARTLDRVAASAMLTNAQASRSMVAGMGAFGGDGARIQADMRASERMIAGLSGPATAAERALAGAKGQMTEFGDVTRLSSFQLLNMQMQMQDMAVMLASGQSPGIMLMQQGSQIVQAFGPGTGVRGALAAVGTGIVQFITNPLNLALLGFSAAAGAASALWRAWDAGAPSMEDSLERATDLVAELKDGLSGVGDEIDRLGRRSDAVVQVQADILRNQLQRQMLTDSVGQMTGGRLGEIFGGGMMESVRTRVGVIGQRVAAEYAALSEPILELQKDIAAGTPDVLEFQDALAKIYREHPGESQITKLVGELLDATDPLAEVQRRLEQLGAGMEKINLHPVVSPRGAEDYSMRRLDKIDAGKLDDVARLEVERLAEQQSGFRDAAQAVEERTAALRLDMQTIGMSTFAATRYRTEQELLNAALRAHLELTPALRSEIALMAEVEARASAQTEQMTDAYDQTIERMDAFRSTAKGALSGFTSDLLAGKDAADALANSVGRIFDKLIGVGEDALIDALFDKQGSAGGGWLGGKLNPHLALPESAPSIPAAISQSWATDAIQTRDLPFPPGVGGSGHNAILDLIMRAEGTAQGRGYNETLGYGAFTGGNRNLTGMSLDEIDRLQTGMLRHPDNPFNSSAVGGFQITQRTMRGLRDTMGLRGDELYDPAMQDQMAMELLRQRQGQGIGGLRNEWEGLNNVNPEEIQQALEASSQQITGSLTDLGANMQQAADSFAPDMTSALQKILSSMGGGGGLSLDALLGIASAGGGLYSRTDPMVAPPARGGGQAAGFGGAPRINVNIANGQGVESSVKGVRQNQDGSLDLDMVTKRLEKHFEGKYRDEAAQAVDQLGLRNMSIPEEQFRHKAVWRVNQTEPGFIHPSVEVDPTTRILPLASIGENVRIGRQGRVGGFIGSDTTCGSRLSMDPGAFVGPRCRIGLDVRIGAGVRVSNDVTIGNGVKLGPGVRVRSFAVIGSHVRVPPGAWIGTDVQVDAFSWFYVAGPQGSRGSITTAIWTPQKGLRWWVGCQRGMTTETFRKRVLLHRGGTRHEADYLHTIDAVENHPALRHAMAKAGQAEPLSPMIGHNSRGAAYAAGEEA